MVRSNSVRTNSVLSNRVLSNRVLLNRAPSFRRYAPQPQSLSLRRESMRGTLKRVPDGRSVRRDRRRDCKIANRLRNYRQALPERFGCRLRCSRQDVDDLLFQQILFALAAEQLLDRCPNCDRFAWQFFDRRFGGAGFGLICFAATTAGRFFRCWLSKRSSRCHSLKNQAGGVTLFARAQFIFSESEKQQQESQHC